MTGHPLLRVERLAKHYGVAPVFEQVSFDVARGEVVAILGESGVGKSTLLNALAGLDAPSAGRVELAGRSLMSLDERALAHWRRANVGFVFQAFHVLPHLNVAQNIALPLLLLGFLICNRQNAGSFGCYAGHGETSCTARMIA